jgi:PAS domain S-box-containing protein
MPDSQTVEELQKRIAFLEESLDGRTRELNQRIRELNCMVQISRLSDRPELPFEHFISETLKIIASSFEHADIACAELKLDEETFQTTNFSKSEWKLGRGLMDQDTMIGYLTVCYPEYKEEKDHGPFTKEEKNFMIIVTRYLVQIIKRKRYEDQMIIFREVLEQSPNMIFITDHAGRIMFLNEQAHRIFGQSLEDLKGKVNYLSLAPDADASTGENIRKALSEGKLYKGEMQALDKNGTSLHARAIISPIRKNNRLISWVTQLEDITKETMLKRLNWEHQERYRAVVENSPISLALVDRNGKFIFINHHGASQLGLPVNAILDKTILDIFGEQGRETMKHFRKIFKDRKGMNLETSYRLQGEIKYFEIARKPIFNQEGKVSFVMSLGNDITERKQMDWLIKLQHSIDSLQSLSDTFEKSLKNLFDNLFTLSWITAGGLYIFSDEKKVLELIYHRGLSDEFIKESASYPMDSPHVAKVLERVPRFANIHNFIPDGKGVLIREKLTFVCVLPLIFRDTVIGCLNLGSNTVDDISAFERMSVESIGGRVATVVALSQSQELLKKTNEELAGTLGSLDENRQLLIQKSRLESLGELSAGLAHEINQPLSIISLAIENLELKLQKGMTDKEYLVAKFGSISNNIVKIRQLIDHIRLFSRDQKENIVQRIDVNHTIVEALSLINEQLRNHRITVTLNLGEDLGVIIGNQSRLEQVIMNLLSNSRDALYEKEQFSSKPGQPKEIRITTKNVGEFTEIEVWDNGTGIGKENLERMFDPFFSTKPYGQGTGLGLSIVYSIIREMNGTIMAKSIQGKYMRFLIRIPVLKQRVQNT